MTPNPTSALDGAAPGVLLDPESTPTVPGLSARQWVGLITAPLAFVWFIWGPAPTGTSIAMRWAAALTAVMAMLWICESVPLAATAVLPLVFLPLVGISTAGEASGAYANDLIFLFIGGFMLGNGIDRWGLHRRVSLGILAVLGNRKRRLVGGVMAATAFVSLWISNTAAALLMMPVGMSLLRPEPLDKRFGAAMALGIAAAASIGGMGTPVGSTPNLLFINTVRNLYHIDVGFPQWMALGIPLVFLYTLFAWWLFTFVLFPLGQSSMAQEQEALALARKELGPIRFGELLVGGVFLLTVLAWIFREPRTIGGFHFGLAVLWPGISDGTIAIAGALALLLTPVSLRPGRFALDWETAARIPWNIILLFGGGLCLADGIHRSGLDTMLMKSISGLQAMPGWWVIVLVSLICIGLSEIASNTATAALLLPLAGVAAVGLGQNPLYLMLPVAFATSLGFMLPVATPPNALAMATGYVSITQMAWAGFLLNLAGLILIVSLIYLIGYRVFDVAL